MSLILGLAAATFWAVHDLLVRQISQRTAILPTLFIVLACGTIFLLPPAVLSQDWGALTKADTVVSVFAGIAYAFASLSLYAAFSSGPVRLVAPIIGSFPVLSMAWAMFGGAVITGLQWGAAVLVVLGVAMVTTLSDPERAEGNKRRAIVFAALASIGFAITFAASQFAITGGAPVPVIFVARLSALITAGMLLIAMRQHRSLPLHLLGRLAVMGVLDASALGFVTGAGALLHPERAAVAASLFGMLTIVLARAVLREPMNAWQWTAVIPVFCGIAILGMT